MERHLSFSKSIILIVFILAVLFVSIFILKAEPHIPLLATTVGIASLRGCSGFPGSIWNPLSFKAFKRRLCRFSSFRSSAF